MPKDVIDSTCTQWPFSSITPEEGSKVTTSFGTNEAQQLLYSLFDIPVTADGSFNCFTFPIPLPDCYAALLMMSLCIPMQSKQAIPLPPSPPPSLPPSGSSGSLPSAEVCEWSTSQSK